MFTVSPSIYSADLMDLRNVLKKSKDFEHLHLDIDDGHFVRGISFGMDMVEQICQCTDVELDAHLEVNNPMDYVEALCLSKVAMISAHIETLNYPSLFFSTVHKYNKKASIALNLKTPLIYIKPYLDQIDHLLLVSVEADVEGLPFRKSVLEKITEARQMLGDRIPIWVDGGINDSNLEEVVRAGADGVVIGRAVFKADDFKKAYDHFLSIGRTYEAQR
ncbi:MAG: ribulose-phosphate 3-epimerase [Erysipelotrichaceae bacterium]|nr:ribulose-phosphate 3-epimerase [Erysipelotrichaceae bacterium]MBR6261573.1 ribulose-phosphate 3-epimerase [Erysipelotrichaceae bacterium]